MAVGLSSHITPEGINREDMLSGVSMITKTFFLA
jgi:hypothetical protein